MRAVLAGGARQGRVYGWMVVYARGAAGAALLHGNIGMSASTLCQIHNNDVRLAFLLIAGLGATAAKRIASSSTATATHRRPGTC